MALYRGHADEQPLSNLLVRGSRRHQLADPKLSRRELAVRGRAPGADPRQLCPSQPGPSRGCDLVECSRGLLERLTRGAPLSMPALRSAQDEQRSGAVEAQSEPGIVVRRFS